MKEYSSDSIIRDIEAMTTASAQNTIWISLLCNQAIYSSIPQVSTSSNIRLIGSYSWIIIRDIPNSITPQTTLRLLPIPVGLLVFPCTRRCRRYPLLSPLIFLSRTEEPAKAGTCARDRRALQQLALNVHVKHSDLI